MIELTNDESRVLGVLIEKALTVPDQYPLSLNAIVQGASQKNNREPVIAFTEEQAREVVERLREKGLLVRIDQVGARVPKFRHAAAEKLPARTGELAILAELLLRGPQTLGELRGRGSRMHPMESLEAAKDMLRALMERPEALVKQIPPSPGSRAERYVQLLCPELHPIQSIETAGEGGGMVAAAPAGSSAPSLGSRVEELEGRVAHLEEALRRLAAAVGEEDPIGKGQERTSNTEH